MYVCVCYALSKTKLCTLISQGAQTLSALQNKCGAGTGCGTCVYKLKNLLSKEKASEAENEGNIKGPGEKSSPHRQD